MEGRKISFHTTGECGKKSDDRGNNTSDCLRVEGGGVGVARGTCSVMSFRFLFQQHPEQPSCCDRRCWPGEWAFRARPSREGARVATAERLAARVKGRHRRQEPTPGRLARSAAAAFLFWTRWRNQSPPALASPPPRPGAYLGGGRPFPSSPSSRRSFCCRGAWQRG